MAASTSGALKAFIESQNLGLSVYRDVAPEGAARPYVTVVEAIAKVPDPLEDGAISTVAETAQADLWQDWRGSDNKLLENYTLADRLVAVLHGATLAVVGTSVIYGVLVRNAPRLLERDENVVHHALTLVIHRQN